MFKDHHYLSGDINKLSRCYIGLWDGNPIAFGATIPLPNGAIKNAWRGHRIVVLPDYQGMGIGVRFSDCIGQIHLDSGHRFYSRTMHPRLIKYREDSPYWKPTSKHKKLRTDIKHVKIFNNHITDNIRVCGSFEYIGKK